MIIGFRNTLYTTAYRNVRTRLVHVKRSTIDF